MINLIREFIAIPSIANLEKENKQAMLYLESKLEKIGFIVEVLGDSPTKQPVLVGRYINKNNSNNIVLYNHYDVEKINREEKWNTNPFELEEIEDRLYGRGVADNKGILLTRLLAIEELANKEVELPNILWIIQGEEEVAGPTPFEIIPSLLDNFEACFYLEETGVVKEDGTPVIFYLCNGNSDVPLIVKELNEMVFENKAIFENRHLNKFTKCPFVTNIPLKGVYVGFGPNDNQCRIHRDNESLSKSLLKKHYADFMKFITWIGKRGKPIKG